MLSSTSWATTRPSLLPSLHNTLVLKTPSRRFCLSRTGSSCLWRHPKSSKMFPLFCSRPTNTVSVLVLCNLKLSDTLELGYLCFLIRRRIQTPKRKLNTLLVVIRTAQLKTSTTIRDPWSASSSESHPRLNTWVLTVARARPTSSQFMVFRATNRGEEDLVLEAETSRTTNYGLTRTSRTRAMWVMVPTWPMATVLLRHQARKSWKLETLKFGGWAQLRTWRSMKSTRKTEHKSNLFANVRATRRRKVNKQELVSGMATELLFGNFHRNFRKDVWTPGPGSGRLGARQITAKMILWIYLMLAAQTAEISTGSRGCWKTITLAMSGYDTHTGIKN